MQVYEELYKSVIRLKPQQEKAPHCLEDAINEYSIGSFLATSIISSVEVDLQV